VEYVVVLKSLKNTDEVITLSEATSRENAEAIRKNFRRILGGKNWTVDRRPGLDTLDMLALTVEAAGGPRVPGYTSRGARLLQAVTARQRAKAAGE
jgi:hypothetical protein